MASTRKIIPAALFVLFWGLYVFLGIALGKTTAYHYNDALFGADLERVLGDMTAIAGDHSRTAIHPLFMLMANPAGVVLAAATGSRVAGAVIWNGAAGALCVALGFAFLSRAGMGAWRAAAWAALLGFSATHLFFGAVPETWIFAGLGVVLLATCAQRWPADWRRFVPAGVFALGAVTPNGAAALIAYAAGAARGSRPGRAVGKVAAYAAAVVGGAAGLSLVQKLIWPTSYLFFIPSAWRDDVTWYLGRLLHAGETAARAARLAGYFFLYDVVAPRLAVAPGPSHKVCVPDVPYVTFNLGAFRPAGIAAAALWLVLLGAGVFGWTRRRGERQPAATALWLLLVFNAVLLMLYGSNELFLYGANTVFIVWALAALGAQGYYAAARPLVRWLHTGVLCACLVLVAINNLAFFLELVKLYRENLIPLPW